jgi:hypothetical protein
MTREEVETILGEYGDHKTGPLDYWWPPGTPHIGTVPITREFGQIPSADQRGRTVLWRDDRGSMVLWFDRAERLIHGAYCKAKEKDPKK